MSLDWGGMKPKLDQIKPPFPDFWRYGIPPPYEQAHCPAWPASMQLYWWCSITTATVVIIMAFYNLHLKLTGHSFFNWCISCCKRILPKFTWQELFIPFCILPPFTFSDPLLKFKVLWQQLHAFALFFHWVLFRDSYQSCPSTDKTVKKKPKPKLTLPRVQSKRMAMTCLAALATIGTASPFQLKSEHNLRRDLRKFKAPCGGLDSNKLSNNPRQSHVHKALLTRLKDDCSIFTEAVNSALVAISSAVIDCGASFAGINDSNLHMVIPDSWVKLLKPIMLDAV